MLSRAIQKRKEKDLPSDIRDCDYCTKAGKACNSHGTGKKMH